MGRHQNHPPHHHHRHQYLRCCLPSESVSRSRWHREGTRLTVSNSVSIIIGIRIVSNAIRVRVQGFRHRVGMHLNRLRHHRRHSVSALLPVPSESVSTVSVASSGNASVICYAITIIVSIGIVSTPSESVSSVSVESRGKHQSHQQHHHHRHQCLHCYQYRQSQCRVSRWHRVGKRLSRRPHHRYRHPYRRCYHTIGVRINVSVASKGKHPSRRRRHRHHHLYPQDPRHRNRYQRLSSV